MPNKIKELELVSCGGALKAKNTASIVALIYLKDCPHCTEAFRIMNAVKVKVEACNFYLINAEKEPRVKELVKSVPSFYGFKGGEPLGKMGTKLTPQSLYDFWCQVATFVPPQNNQPNQPNQPQPTEVAKPEDAKNPIIYGNPIHDRYLTISP